MLVWLLFLALIVAEIAALWVWLHREYYPVIFNTWAIAIYTFTFTADAVLVWFLSRVIDPTATSGVELIMVLSIIALVVVVAFTFFFRWVVRQDLPEPPK